MWLDVCFCTIIHSLFFMYIFASFVVSYDDDGGDGGGDFWFDTLDKWLYKWQTQNNNKYIIKKNGSYF